MHSPLRIASLTSTVALMAGSLSSKTPTEIAPDQTLSIRLYNQAQVPNSVLRLATNETDRLFRKAGLRIVWNQPSAESVEDRGSDLSVPALRQSDARGYIVVRLTPRTSAAVFVGALGYALPFARTGAHVFIFYDRVQMLTDRVRAPAYVILGYSMAHEIAHVLLGSSEHSKGGVMEARWNPDSWRLATAGLVGFSREEIERIRAGSQRFRSPSGKVPLATVAEMSALRSNGLPKTPPKKIPR